MLSLVIQLLQLTLFLHNLACDSDIRVHTNSFNQLTLLYIASRQATVWPFSDLVRNSEDWIAQNGLSASLSASSPHCTAWAECEVASRAV